MCVKLIPVLNPRTPRVFYTCKVTVALRVCNGNQNCFSKYLKHSFLLLLF